MSGVKNVFMMPMSCKSGSGFLVYKRAFSTFTRVSGSQQNARNPNLGSDFDLDPARKPGELLSTKGILLQG